MSPTSSFSPASGITVEYMDYSPPEIIISDSTIRLSMQEKNIINLLAIETQDGWVDIGFSLKGCQGSCNHFIIQFRSSEIGMPGEAWDQVLYFIRNNGTVPCEKTSSPSPPVAISSKEDPISYRKRMGLCIKCGSKGYFSELQCICPEHGIIF